MDDEGSDDRITVVSGNPVVNLSGEYKNFEGQATGAIFPRALPLTVLSLKVPNIPEHKHTLLYVLNTSYGMFPKTVKLGKGNVLELDKLGKVEI